MTRRDHETKHSKSKRFPLFTVILLVCFLAIPIISIGFYMSEGGGNMEADTTAQNGAFLSSDEVAIPTATPYIPTQDNFDDDDAVQQATPVRTPDPNAIGIVYLTIDDGPSRDVTPGMLDLFLEEDVRATFFVHNKNNMHDIYQRILDEGHDLGNHTSHHNYDVLYRDAESFTSAFLRAHNFILDEFGYEMTLFRLPGGPWNARQRNFFEEARAIVREHGYIDYCWHVDSYDWRGIGAESIANNVIDGVLEASRNGRRHIIVLMHDGWEHERIPTMEALSEIIRVLREEGFDFDGMSNFPGTCPCQ